MSELKRIFDNMWNNWESKWNSPLGDLFDRISKWTTEENVQKWGLKEVFKKIQAWKQVQSILDENPTSPNKKIF